jgi:hypothetical protein
MKGYRKVYQGGPHKRVNYRLLSRAVDVLLILAGAGLVYWALVS